MVSLTKEVGTVGELIVQQTYQSLVVNGAVFLERGYKGDAQSLEYIVYHTE